MRSPSGDTMITIDPVSASGSAAIRASTPYSTGYCPVVNGIHAPHHPANTTGTPRCGGRGTWSFADRGPGADHRPGVAAAYHRLDRLDEDVVDDVSAHDEPGSRKLTGHEKPGRSGPVAGDLGGEPDVGARQPQVHLQAQPAGHLTEECGRAGTG